jgi:hypothetical protein
MTDHATEARAHIGWVHDWQEREGETDATQLANVAVAQTHALLAIAEQLATIARRLSEPVANDLRAEVQPPAHPGGWVREPEVAIRGGRLTASVADELRAQVINMHRTASPDQEGDQ